MFAVSVGRSIAKEEDDDDLIHAASLVLPDHERAAEYVGTTNEEAIGAGWGANCDIGSNH